MNMPRPIASMIRVNTANSRQRVSGVPSAASTIDTIIATTMPARSIKSANAIVIKHQSSNSAVGNRFDLPGAGDILLAQRGTATFIYDAATGFWELISTN